MSTALPAGSAFNRPAKKSRTRAVVLLGLVVLALLGLKYAPASSAAPGDYNDGLKTVICQNLGTGMSREYLVGELQAAFADSAAMTGQHLTRTDWTVYVNQAVAEKCPTYSEEWNR